jgi:hypothetical protein
MIERKKFESNWNPPFKSIENYWPMGSDQGGRGDRRREIKSSRVDVFYMYGLLIC